MTAFTPRSIPVPFTDGQAYSWTAWRELMREHIAGAQTEADLSAITDLNQQAFADCCERGPNSYRLICDALDTRRKQMRSGLAVSA